MDFDAWRKACRRRLTPGRVGRLALASKPALLDLSIQTLDERGFVRPRIGIPGVRWGLAANLA